MARRHHSHELKQQKNLQNYLLDLKLKFVKLDGGNLVGSNFG